MIDCFDMEGDISSLILNKAPIDQVWVTFKTQILQTANKNISSRTWKPTPNH